MSKHGSVLVLATGERFIGRGIRAIEPVIWELIAGATSEIHIAVYRMDAEAAPILDLLERALQSGIGVTLVLSDMRRQPEVIRHKLQNLCRTYNHMTLADVEQRGYGLLHAKVVVADRSRAIVGSANLTAGGLGINHEIALLVDDGAAWQVADLIDILAESDEER